MKEEHRPTLEALEAQLKELERKIAAKKKTINEVCELAQIPPMYVDVDTPELRSFGTLRTDQFYGKGLTTAAREYLEIRKASNRGPASPREIYDALVAGGFKFDVASDINAITGIRQILRKNSSVFHRLPNNQYGLLIWYPNAKAAKLENGDHSTSQTRRTRTKKPRPVRAPRATKAGKVAKGSSIDPFILQAMNDGTKWTTERLKQEAIARSLPGMDASTKKNRIHIALILLKKRGLVENVGKGVWQIVKVGGTRTIKGEAA